RLPPTSPLFPYTTLFRSEERSQRAATPRERLQHSGLHGQEDIFDQLHAALERRGTQRIGGLEDVRSAAQAEVLAGQPQVAELPADRKSTRLNSSHVKISY